jgi:hypothetical protein
MSPPAPSPPEPPPVKPGPSRKAIIGWTLAMLAVVGLACFTGFVVVPIWQTRQIVMKMDKEATTSVIAPHNYIQSLGGPENAVRRLHRYVRLPDWAAPEKDTAVQLLGFCEDPALPVLLELLRDRDPVLRAGAALSLGYIGAPEAFEPVAAALQDPNPPVRRDAERALAQLGWADGLRVQILGPGSVGPDEKQQDLIVAVTNNGTKSLAVLSGAFCAKSVSGDARVEIWPSSGPRAVFVGFQEIQPGATVQLRVPGHIEARGYCLRGEDGRLRLPPGRHRIRVVYYAAGAEKTWSSFRPQSLWTGTLETARFDLEVVGR